MKNTPKMDGQSDYFITVKVEVVSDKLRIISTISPCPDHFINSIFCDGITFFEEPGMPSINLSKVDDREWHLLGNIHELDRTIYKIKEWQSGIYIYSAQALRHHSIDVIAWEVTLGDYDLYGKHFPRSPPPISSDIYAEKGKCRNTLCCYKNSCLKFHLDGEQYYEHHFVPPDDFTCSYLEYTGLHPDLSDCTDGYTKKYFGLYAGSRGCWIGAFDSLQAAIDIVEPATDHMIGGYSDLSVHTFDTLPEDCEYYENPIDSVL